MQKNLVVSFICAIFVSVKETDMKLFLYLIGLVVVVWVVLCNLPAIIGFFVWVITHFWYAMGCLLMTLLIIWLC